MRFVLIIMILSFSPYSQVADSTIDHWKHMTTNQLIKVKDNCSQSVNNIDNKLNEIDNKLDSIKFDGLYEKLDSLKVNLTQKEIDKYNTEIDKQIEIVKLLKRFLKGLKVNGGDKLKKEDFDYIIDLFNGKDVDLAFNKIAANFDTIQFKKISNLAQTQDSLVNKKRLLLNSKQVLEDIYEEVADKNKIANSRANRIKKMEAKYKTSEFKQDIINRHVAIGMNKEMIIDSWGKPEEINRTVGTWGVHEQWVYGRTYLYVENGILTSFQD